ncbi:glutathione S-transferase family protein [Loigolactobacillus coryniformis subsp. coryniformis]|uniref:glutathione S-transferase family protein n=1 Tax=Loigolactobacillus coryniformis TaxID=1610 RepID=UPI003995F73F
MAEDLKAILAQVNTDDSGVSCSIDFSRGQKSSAPESDSKQIAFSEDAHEITADGHFQRQANRFTGRFGDQPGEFPVEAGRYRLIWSQTCPWSQRAVIARALLGLEDVISVGEVGPTRSDHGWTFAKSLTGLDPVLVVADLPTIYQRSDPSYTGRATVPAVVDLTTGKVVNNDYFTLTNQLEVAFKPLQKADAPDLYPEELRADIDALNDIIFHEVNNGVYKAGFAQSQVAYEEAYDVLFKRLDWLEERLGHQRYLFGDQLTDSDIRLYVTLARFDVAYYPVFHTNRNLLRDFPNLWAYARGLYQKPEFGDSTNFTGIKQGYQLLNEVANPYNLLTVGPDEKDWLVPDQRQFN